MTTPTLTSQPASSSKRSTGTAKLNAPSVEQTTAVRLQTGSLHSTSTRRSYHCRFVKAGRVRSSANTLSNIEITPQSLQTDWSSGLFNGKAVFIATPPSGTPSIENLVGVTQSSTWNEEDV